MVKRKFQKRKVFLNEFHNGKLVLQTYFKPSEGLKEIDAQIELNVLMDEELKEQGVLPKDTVVTYKLTLNEEKGFQL